MSVKGTQNLKSDDDYGTGTLSLTLQHPLYDQGLSASIVAKIRRSGEADATLAAYRQSHIVSVTRAYFAVLSSEQVCWHLWLKSKRSSVSWNRPPGSNSRYWDTVGR